MAEIILSKEKIEVHQRRWLYLALLGVLFLLQAFNLNLEEAYEYVTTHITIGHGKNIKLYISPGGLAFSPLLAWLTFHKHIGLRKLIVFLSVLLVSTSAFNMIQYFTQSFEFLNFVNQEVAKISQTLSLSIPPTFAAQWFPENQIGLVIGILGIGWSGDCILPSLFHKTSGNNSTFDSTNISIILHDHHNISQTDDDKTFHKNAVQIFLITFVCLSLLILVFSCLLQTDAPPNSPSTSQLQTKLLVEDKELKSFFDESKKLVFDFVFIFYGFAFTLIFSLIIIERKVLLKFVSQNVEENMQTLKTDHVVTLYSVGSIAGSIAAGVILDRWKRHRLHAMITTASSFVLCLFVLLTCFMKHLIASCVGLVLLAVTSSASLPPLLDSVLQHHYPVNPLFLTSWLSFKLNIVEFLLNLCGKMLLDKLGVVSVLVFQCLVLLLSFIVLFFAKPELKRWQIENSSKPSSEKDGLLKRTF